MRRKAIENLIKWKEYENRKPVIITGAKGVGKTYLAYDFAKSFFQHIHYINFERDNTLKGMLSGSDSSNAISTLKRYTDYIDESEPMNHILILDEISHCQDIKYLMNLLTASDLFPYIIAISSNPVPVNVGEEYISLTLYPLEFDEFLLATANEWYIEAIINTFGSNKELPGIVHKELLDLHQLYLQIGGMPGILNEYLNLSGTINIREQQNMLISAYHDYILKEGSDGDSVKMNQVIDCLAQQLTKENRKFQYKLIRKGTTHAMYKGAIQKLAERKYILKCCKLADEELNTMHKAITDQEWNSSNSNFKLYYSDTGLLSCKIAEEESLQISPYRTTALLENYIAQSLQTKDYPFGFWESGSMAKIDFIYEKDHTIIPIELFDSDNTRSKSIHILKQKCDFPYAIKISSRNFSSSNNIRYIPYYAVFCL